MGVLLIFGAGQLWISSLTRSTLEIEAKSDSIEYSKLIEAFTW